MRKLKIICVLLILLLIPSSIGAVPITNVDQLKDTDSLKNPFKIWSVLKASGFSDSAAAGVLGNMQRESSFDPSTVEGIYGEYLNPKGEKKKVALQDLNNYAINTLFPLYKKEGWGILPSSNQQGQSVSASPAQSGKANIDTKAYLGKDGKYTVGIGLIQYTGYRASLLTLWAEKNNYAWYDLDVQLVYFLHNGEDGDTRTKWLLEEYRNVENSSPEEMGYLFSIKYEGQTVDAQNRRATARYWFDKFRGQKGDANYAQKILSKIGLATSYKIEDSFQDRSIYRDVLGTALILPENSGNLFQKDKHSEIALSIQDEVIGEKKSEKQYSLYQRFGNDIHFFRYLGESTQPIELLDHVYSVVGQDSLDMLNFKTIFYPSTSYLSNQVYKGRPRVLTPQNIKEGLSDPRVNTTELTIFSGYVFNYGEFNLAIGKFLTNLTTTLIGKEPIKAIKALTDIVLNPAIFTKFFQPILTVFLAFAMIFFLFSLTKIVLNYLNGNIRSISKFFIRIGVGILTIGLIFVLASNPTRFSELTYKAVTGIDSIFGQALNLQMEKDPIVYNTDGELTQEAILWKKTLFEPYIRGVFKTDYENLYTQYSDKEDKHKMKQSNASKEEIQKLEPNQIAYNSAERTGDVVVPLGNGVVERNWAAYLYSVQSPYHIDHTVTSGENGTPLKTFPNAIVTANNKNLRADAFRLIDAMMNISPQIYKDNLIVENYTNSRLIQEDYIAQSNVMLMNSIVLGLFFLPLIFKKLYHLLLIFLSSVMIIFHAFKELVKEGDGLKEALAMFGSQFLGFFLTTFKLYILTIFYNTLIGKGFIPFILFIILGLVVYGMTFKQIRQKVRDTYDWSKYTYRAVLNRF